MQNAPYRISRGEIALIRPILRPILVRGVGVEPPAGNNAPGTAIPDGTYFGEPTSAAESASFSVDQLRIRDVPGNRSPDNNPILWHPRNRPDQAQGCYLPGEGRAPNGTDVMQSRDALSELTDQVGAHAAFVMLRLW